MQETGVGIHPNPWFYHLGQGLGVLDLEYLVKNDFSALKWKGTVLPCNNNAWKKKKNIHTA